MNHGPNGVTQLLRDVISHSKPGEEGEQASLEVLSSLSSRLASPNWCTRYKPVRSELPSVLPGHTSTR